MTKSIITSILLINYIDATRLLQQFNLPNIPGFNVPVPIPAPQPGIPQIPNLCGNVEHCGIYWNGCTNCNCDGSSNKPLCTNRGCPFAQIVPNYCIECATGYQMLNGICVPECGGIPYCSSYMPDPCNSCSCGLGELPTCSQTVCPNAGGFPTRCIGCVDGYILDSNTRKCVRGCNGIKHCQQCAFQFTDPFGYVCVECSTGYAVDPKTGRCIPGCGGIQHCLSYTPDECNSCTCDIETGLETCGNANCVYPPLEHNRCLECVNGYVLDEFGECVPGCGGFEQCYSYSPDSCYICSCDPSVHQFLYQYYSNWIFTGAESCSLSVNCGDPSKVAANECLACQPGYTLNVNSLECEKNAPTSAPPSGICAFLSCSDPIQNAFLADFCCGL